MNDLRPRSATFAIGAVVGGLGGATALACAGLVAGRAATPALVAAAVGARLGWTAHATAAGFAFGAASGWLLGGALALVLRHAERLFARLLFATIVGAALWLCCHVELVAHRAATLPLVPMVVAVCVHGALVACIPVPRH